MKKFITKLTTVNAIQYDGGNFVELEKLTDGRASKPGGKSDIVLLAMPSEQMPLYTGNWVLKYDNNELSVLSDQSFKENFNEINDADIQAETDLLTQACDPAIKYLNDQYHPHTMIIITPTGVQVFEASRYIGDIASLEGLKKILLAAQ